MVWNLNHDEFHLESEKMFNGKKVGCEICRIY